jgi:hypothetical protein
MGADGVHDKQCRVGACRATLSFVVDDLSRAAQQIDLAVNMTNATLVHKPVSGRAPLGTAIGILKFDLDEFVGESGR